MKEQLINFETAKLAKKKGFNIKGYNFYQINGEILINELKAAKVNSRFYSFHDSFELYKNHNENSLWCSAPTQSLLQKWLREVHNIHLWCEHQHKELDNVYGYRINGDVQTSRFTYNNWTYEEALEQGLQEALKLI